MWIFGNFLFALAKILDTVIYTYMLIVIVRALLSWVNPDPNNPIVRFLYNVTEPVMARVRRTIPCYFGGMDLSPMIVILVLYFLQAFLVPTLARIGYSMM